MKVNTLYTMFAALCIVLIAYGLYRLLRIGSRPPNFPPGPPTEPILGNLRQIPSFYEEPVFQEWTEKYGSIFSIMKGPCPFIVVNEKDAAHELFNKLGQYTSSRPDRLTDLVSRGNYEPIQANGPVWRVARRQWHAMLNVTAAKQYLPYQVLESTKLLYDLLNTPNDFDKHIQRYSNSVAMSMAAGYRVPSSNDPVVSKILASTTNWARYNILNDWTNFFPILFKIPSFLPGPRRYGEQVFAEYRDKVLRTFEETQKSNLPSFYQVIRNNQKAMNLSDMEATSLAALMAEAGTETTTNVINGWVATMALFPEVQQKAQEEIDRVIGPDCLPNEEDAANLPYLKQVIQELHRWYTVSRFGMTHAATKSFEWRGYKIPEGTGLILNATAIHHDPKLYPRPHEFVPERWEGKLSRAASSENSVGEYTELFDFGAGRRICPGQHLAERSLYLAASRWLWAFRIEKARDESGKEIDIDMTAMRPGFSRTLLPYKAKITPRSEAKAQLIREAWSQMKDELLTSDEQWKNTPDTVLGVMEKAKSQRAQQK